MRCKIYEREVPNIPSHVTWVTCSECIAANMGSAKQEGLSKTAILKLKPMLTRTCCNFIHGRHLGDRPCTVLHGQRCSFLDSVISTADEKDRAVYINEVCKGKTPEHTLDPDVETPGIRTEPLPPEAFCGTDMKPLRAIRARCLECTETQPEIKHCPCDGVHGDLCPLWPYRLGKNPYDSRASQKTVELCGIHPPTNTQGSKTPSTTDEARSAACIPVEKPRRGFLSAIREHCLRCCDDQPVEVRLCSATDCPLWQFRFGRKSKRMYP